MNLIRNTDTINSYIKEISKISTLTKSEEKELFIEYNKTKTNNIRNKIIKHNLKFVITICKKYQHLGVPISDLIEYGNEGLFMAVDRFNHSMNYKFITFAVYWIKVCIREGINEYTNKVRIPSNKSSELLSVYNKMNKFQLQNERVAHIDDIETTIKDKDFDYLCKITNIRSYYETVNSIDDSSPNFTHDVILDKLIDNELEPPDYTIEIETRNKEISNILNELLDKREVEVLKMVYGLDGGFEKSVTDISKTIGRTERRVIQIKENALEKLKINKQRIIKDII